MPTVVPSQIVQFIDTTMIDLMVASAEGIQVSPRTCGTLNALLRLIEQLPNALGPRDPRAYAQFVLSQESIRVAVRKAQIQNVHQDLQMLPWLTPDGDGRKTQVQVIRDALSTCPDEVPPEQSKELPFIGSAREFVELLN